MKYFCNLYNLIIGHTLSWESCHEYFKCMIYHDTVTIISELHSQLLNEKYLFELTI